MIRRNWAVLVVIGGYCALNGACLNPRPEEFPSRTGPGNNVNGSAGGPPGNDGPPDLSDNGDGEPVDPLQPGIKEPSSNEGAGGTNAGPADAGAPSPDAGDRQDAAPERDED